MRHWWCILFLPFFNFAVFFIRLAGIINSIETDSSWKTMNLSEECRAFADVVKNDFSKPVNVIKKVRNALNYDVVEDNNNNNQREEHGKEA
jgi:biofilm PGA synthesis N-glycosyltransferase PgaC